METLKKEDQEKLQVLQRIEKEQSNNLQRIADILCDVWQERSDTEKRLENVRGQISGLIKKTLIVLVAISTFTITENAKAQDGYIRGTLPELLCNEEYTCSKLQISFLEKIGKLIFESGAPITIVNDGEKILSSNRPVGWFEIDKDDNAISCNPLFCIDQGKKSDSVIEFYKKKIKLILKEIEAMRSKA